MTVTTRPSRSRPPVAQPDVATPLRAPAAGEVAVGRARAYPTRREGPAKLTGTALYNQYRSGVGHYNMTDVNVMRVIEIGLKYRF